MAVDPRMRMCPACQRYVMPQRQGIRFGLGGPLFLALALAAVIWSGPVGKIAGVIGLVAVGGVLLILLVVRVVGAAAERGTCPICKGPV